MPRSKTIAAAVLASGLLMLLQGGVEARAGSIECAGNFQFVDGDWVGTPYCRARNLARVARSYGIRVSARKIRSSESAKADVCRVVGYDNRVREVCAPYLSDGGGRFRF